MPNPSTAARSFSSLVVSHSNDHNLAAMPKVCEERTVLLAVCARSAAVLPATPPICLLPCPCSCELRWCTSQQSSPTPCLHHALPKQTVVIDARGHMLGRLASIVAKQVLAGHQIVSDRALDRRFIQWWRQEAVSAGAARGEVGPPNGSAWRDRASARSPRSPLAACCCCSHCRRVAGRRRVDAARLLSVAAAEVAEAAVAAVLLSPRCPPQTSLIPNNTPS